MLRHISGLVAWAGPRRIIAALGLVVVALVGGWWLLHAPAPAVERGLPYAGHTSGSGPGSTSIPGPDRPKDTSTPVVVGPTTPSILVVHVAGDVRAPGLVRLAPGARVNDALNAAGGALPDANVDALNLAAFVSDGSRIYVPRVGEVVSTVSDPSGSSGPLLRLGINVASAEQLDALPGVGPSLARAIVLYRTQHGPFRHIDDLLQVPGVGASKLQQLRSFVMV